MQAEPLTHLHGQPHRLRRLDDLQIEAAHPVTDGENRRLTHRAGELPHDGQRFGTEIERRLRHHAPIQQLIAQLIAAAVDIPHQEALANKCRQQPM